MGDPGPEIADIMLDRLAAWNCYQEVRRTTEALCAPLETEDYVIQSMPEASPVKWHLAHTSWFFETFVLSNAQAGFEPVDAEYSYIFNSYYNAIGERIPRDRRGLLSRPTVAEVYRYRDAVDNRIKEFFNRSDDAAFDRVRSTLILGLHHEQQHQELILTDIKHALASNPKRPAYRLRQSDADLGARPHAAGWCSVQSGLRSIGHESAGFAFDNEGPRHQQYVAAFALADRLVTNREYLAFVNDGGYQRPEFWLSDGWNARGRNGWTTPLYWELTADGRQVFTLEGMRDLELDEPVCHVSFYEAEAFARWAGARLPTETEWETMAVGAGVVLDGNFLESGRFHPARPMDIRDAASGSVPMQLFGDVWEWTQSPYTAYHGFRPAEGALGEYNGKFMCNQLVLRGGSCCTPRSHMRPTYRNYFPPESRWQFSGIRLACDV
jgi:ergothioneine biosynthesis protein EgtB